MEMAERQSRRIQKVILGRSMDNAEKRLEEDLAAIYLGNLKTIEQSLTLPRSGRSGSVIVWESDETRFIDENGRVNRPLFGMGDRTVHLTATARLDGAAKSRVFEVNVLQQKKETVIREIPPIFRITSSKGDPELPHYAAALTEDGRCTAVPVRWVLLPEEWNTAGAGGDETIYTGEAEGSDLPVFLYLKRVERSGTTGAPSLRFPGPGTVRLLPGSVFYEAAVRMEEWLLSEDNDKMLYNFRAAAGLDTRGAERMTGWDAPSGNLMGTYDGTFPFRARPCVCGNRRSSF